MAYPALQVRGANVGGAFLGGMQQGQQMQANQLAIQQQQGQMQRDEQFRNILAQSVGPMAAAAAQPPGDPHAAANYLTQATGNPLASGPSPEQFNQLLALDPERAYQVAAIQQQQQQLQQQQQREEAGQRVRGAQFVLKSKDPKRTLEIGFPDIVENLRQHGHDFDSLSDDDVRMMAQDVLTHYGPIAGVSPAEGESPFAKINPADYTQESVKAFESSGNAGDLVAREKPGDDPNDKLFTRGNQLRNEYEGKRSGFEVVRSAYANIESAERGDAGDTQLVLNFMRTISPGVRVQPGERIEDAASVPGVPQAAIGMWNKVVGGGKLNDGQRKEIRSQAKRTFETQKKLADELRPRYERLAREAKVDPWSVVGDQAAPAGGGGGGGSGSGPQPGAVEDGYRFKGGDPADAKNWEPVK